MMKFRNAGLLLLLSAGLSVWSCVPDNQLDIATSTIELNFRVVYDGQPVQFDQAGFDYDANLRVLFRRFNFYLANAILLAENKVDETELTTIQLLDFSDTDELAEAIAGKSISIRRIPVGKYGGLRFDLGVPNDLNASSFKKDRYFGNHPLNIADQHSSIDGSYIFMKLNGAGDTDLDGSFDDLVFRYQPATARLYKQGLFFSRSFSVEEKSVTKLRFVIDLKKILKPDASGIDIKSFPETFPGNMPTLGKQLMDNFSRAITLE